MNSQLGQGLILLALLCAAGGTAAGLAGGFRRSVEATTIARRFALAFAALSIAANAVMMYALAVDDFSVEYVAAVGSTTTPMYFKIPSLWASLDGSILFWLGILGIYVAVYAWREKPEHAEYAPWALATLMGTSLFFTLLVSSVADPFHHVDVPPGFDGPGPNPLLQNHWLMAFHPPALYGGYVGMVVPFSMAVAALAAGRLEAGWLVPMRRWLLVPWSFLTIGILMGGWWSYGVLGWGGYWAWDPVENASFHPWLTATAALHSALVTQRKGLFKTWTLVLVITSFLLTLFGTFLTRSGVFNSVHAFTTSNIGQVFLGAIAFTFIGSVLLLALRDHALEDQMGLSKRLAPMSLLSRETAILLQNLVFAAFTFVVMFGTVFPLLVEAVENRQLSVGAPFFDRIALPLGLLLVVLMGVGPALPWGRMEPARAARRFMGPAIGGVALAGAGALGGFALPYTMLSLFVCGFALVANLGELIQPVMMRMARRKESAPVALMTVLQRARLRYGGHLSHLGVIVAVASIALSKGYKLERDLTLEPGETGVVSGYELTFTGARVVPEPRQERLIASFAVRSGDRDLGVWEPELNFYRTQREPLGTPAVRTTPAEDLYLSLVQVEPTGAWASVRVMVMPGVWWLWASAPIFLASTLLILWPTRRQQAAAGAVAEAA